MEIISTIGGTLIRHGLSALGVWLVSKGFLDEATATSLVNYLSGAALVILAGVLSYKAKKAA